MSTQKTEHPYLRDGWSMRKSVIPDVNPADEAVARMRRRVFGSDKGNVIGAVGGASGATTANGGGGGGGGGSGGGGASSSGGDGVSGPGGTSTVSSLQSQVSTISTQISGASISAVCNGDGTITVTLTWGS